MMKFTILSGAVALFFASPVMAQTTGPTLWNDVSAGMPKAEVERLHPMKTFGMWMSSPIALTDRCPAWLNFGYDSADKVKLVQIKPPEGGAPARADDSCGKMVMDSLAARYGTPVIASDHPEGGAIVRERSFSVGKIVVTFVGRFIGDASGDWLVKYTYVAEPDTSGAANL